MNCAFVITTHGSSHNEVYECVSRVEYFVPAAKIYIFVNEGKGKNLLLHKTFPRATVVYVKDQRGGLTYTWNRGISLALKARRQVIVLLNNDAYINSTIKDLLLAASNSSRPAIYGPTTTPEGAPYDPCQWTYFNNSTKPLPLYINFLQQWNGLNGFCLAFNARMILSNMYDSKHFFNPNHPFGGNETEWGKRWYLKGGEVGIVESCFVVHNKKASWRTCSVPNKRVKVHKPDLSQVPPKIIKQKDYSVAVVGYVYEKQGIDIIPKKLTMIVPEKNTKSTDTYSLIVNSHKCYKRKDNFKGWEIVGYYNSGKDNFRLRIKTSISVFASILHQNKSDYVLFLSTQRLFTRNLNFFISSILSENEVKDFDIAMFKSDSAPSLMAHMDYMKTMNSVAMSRFSEPESFYPFYSAKTIVLPATKASLDLLNSVMILTSYVNWDFDFAFSWYCFDKRLTVAQIPQDWNSKSFDSYLEFRP